MTFYCNHQWEDGEKENGRVKYPGQFPMGATMKYLYKAGPAFWLQLKKQAMNFLWKFRLSRQATASAV